MKQYEENGILSRYYEHTSLSNRQRAVLRASLVLFAKKGYENTSTKEIAEMAGVAEGTVYKRFKTKRVILETLLAPLENEIIPEVAEQFIGDLAARPETSLADLLSYAVADRLSYAMHNRAALRILLQEISKDPTLLQRLTVRLRSVFDGRVDKLFASYQSRGELLPWPPMRIIRCVTGIMLGYVLPNLLMAETPLDVESVTQQVVAAILHGVSPQPNA
ncbi:TetR/AcrR family transcriptional regulator [Lacticaseibacillus daqingensis]|uniref:TetR/AcrR family transcriptional regulator n=1 Tax=Lacticaseibacillus daqingensis TaxID=2486014 RepID=UPI000F76E862|nr:TetR/AcrR family transcriptional regulator [Lacticaseibacillus daqingensis]